MRALVFDHRLPRLATTRALGLFTAGAYVGPTAPLQLRRIPDPVVPAADWVVIRTHLCGICGSDSKQVFLNGASDNPMTALISFPQVLGHEVVGTIERVGPGVTRRRIGERVVLNPWLSCIPRGLPLCDWCQRGEFAQCLNFTNGSIDAGLHHGNSVQATGGFAKFVPAHESQCIPIPDHISDSSAVLADPFAVALHAVLRDPPQADSVALVYGCGTLGLLTITILHALFPTVRVFAVARFAHQAVLAEKFGAEKIIKHWPKDEVVENVAELLEQKLYTPWRGLPMINGGVDLIYDTVGKAETLEIGVRITRPRGRIVVTGVETPKRFEWTPLYFKELRVIGSNAFATEEYEGRRKHAMEWYFEFIRDKHIDVTPIITHRFALEDYSRAFLTCYRQGRTSAVKVLFDYGLDGASS